MRKIFKDAPSDIVISSLVSMILRLVSVLVIARTIGPEGRGVTASAIALFTFIPVLIAAGLPLEVRRRAVEDLSGTLRGSRLMTILLVFPAIVCALIITPLVAQEVQTDVYVAMIVGCSIAPISVSWMVDNNALVAIGKYRASAFVRMGQPAIFLLLLLGAWAADIVSILFVLVANMIGNVATALIGWWCTRSKIKTPRVPLKILLAGSIKFSGNSIAESAASRADQIIALPILGGYAAGLYSVAVTVSGLPLAVGQALGAAYFRRAMQASTDSLRDLYVSAMKATVSISTVMALGLVVVSPVVVPLVFGQDFQDAVPTVLLMSAFSGLSVISWVASMLHVAAGRGGRMMVAQISGLTVKLGLFFMLGLAFGHFGAGLAATIGFMVVALILVVPLGVPIRAFLPSPRGVVLSVQALKRG